MTRAGIETTADQAKELARYMDGYPPAVNVAVSFAREYGLPSLVADKSILVDFKIRTFSEILGRLRLTDEDWSLLRVLASEPVLPLEALAAVLNIDHATTVARLRTLIDLSLISPRQNLFQIAPPIREAVFLARGRLEDSEFAQIAQTLEQTFWGEDRLPPMAVISATVHAVSRSDSARLGEFGGLVLPSTLFKAAKEKYDDGGQEAWEAARSLLHRLLELDSSHRRARILLLKTLVRLNDWGAAERTLGEIKARGYVEQHYLRGFLLWKRGRLDDAIDAFRSALRAGQRSVEVFHGLAACQYRKGAPEAALETVREGLRGRKPNKLLLDLGVQAAAALEEYKEAEGYLDDLRRLNEDAVFHHRAAALLAAQGEFGEAIIHADKAVRDNRRFEVVANRAHILIELSEFGDAEEEIDYLDRRFRLGNEQSDVRNGLRAKLLIRQDKWRPASDALDNIKDKRTPQYKALKLDVLRLKALDPSVSPGDREAALRERSQLEEARISSRGLVQEPGEGVEIEETEGEDEGPP